MKEFLQFEDTVDGLSHNTQYSHNAANASDTCDYLHRVTKDGCVLLLGKFEVTNPCFDIVTRLFVAY